MDIEKPW